jgi:hypothetical protein
MAARTLEWPYMNSEAAVEYGRDSGPRTKGFWAAASLDDASVSSRPLRSPSLRAPLESGRWVKRDSRGRSSVVSRVRKVEGDALSGLENLSGLSDVKSLPITLLP